MDKKLTPIMAFVWHLVRDVAETGPSATGVPVPVTLFSSPLFGSLHTCRSLDSSLFYSLLAELFASPSASTTAESERDAEPRVRRQRPVIAAADEMPRPPPAPSSRVCLCLQRVNCSRLFLLSVSLFVGRDAGICRFGARRRRRYAAQLSPIAITIAVLGAR